jgi:hypothetical protein
MAKCRQRQSGMSAILSCDNTKLSIPHLDYGGLVCDIGKYKFVLSNHLLEGRKYTDG